MPVMSGVSQPLEYDPLFIVDSCSLPQSHCNECLISLGMGVCVLMCAYLCVRVCRVCPCISVRAHVCLFGVCVCLCVCVCVCVCYWGPRATVGLQRTACAHEVHTMMMCVICLILYSLRNSGNDATQT